MAVYINVAARPLTCPFTAKGYGIKLESLVQSVSSEMEGRNIIVLILGLALETRFAINKERGGVEPVYVLVKTMKDG
jgi:hypothetical protein